MRKDTPPTSPDRLHMPDGDEDSDEELVYIGDLQDFPDQELGEEVEEGEGAERIDGNESDPEGGAIPVVDMSMKTFQKHTGPIFCCNLHPTEDLAVTGGEDDQAYVWNLTTGEVVFHCDKHKDTVVCAEFSYDGAYLATGDLAGEIRVFKVQQEYRQVWEFSMGDMSWMMWHKASNVLIAGADTGEVYVWRIPSGDCKVLQGPGHKAECAQLMQDGKRLVVGYNDGTVKLWDIRTNTVAMELKPGAAYSHTEPVISVSTDGDNNMILTGGMDGKITVLGPNGAVGNLFPSSDTENDTVESVSFSPNAAMKLAVSGTIKGRITVWDVARQTIRCECKNGSDFDGGVTKVLWVDETTVLISFTNGEIKAYDARTGETLVRWERGDYRNIRLL